MIASSQMSIALSVQHISHMYGKTAVLHDVSLTVQHGEVLALLGPSGSGKSTLLHLVGGLDTPSQGAIFWQDQPISSLSGETRAALRNQHLGLIFQHHYLLDDLNALENTMLPSLISGQPQPERAQQLLKQVGLEHRIKHYPQQLSGGERQRVALARALLLRPAILLADEPTGSLDQSNAQSVMQLLLELAQSEGTGVLLVTHDEKSALRAHRVLHLIDGRICEKS